MSKKTLPKAIKREGVGLGQVASGSAAEEHQEQEALARATDWKSGGGNVVIEAGPVPQVSAPPGAHVLASRVLKTAEFDARQRLSQAHAIVERYATYSAAGGIIPLPIANAASVMAIIVRMVKMLSNLYGVPFERDRARASWSEWQGLQRPPASRRSQVQRSFISCRPAPSLAWQSRRLQRLLAPAALAGLSSSTSRAGQL
jgi:hypothetical protein